MRVLSMEKSFSKLLGERLPEEHEHTYRLKGLPAGSDFRDKSSYETLYASWLKVHGVGFSAPYFEFGEYEREVLVYQPSPSGSAHIKFEGV